MKIFRNIAILWLLVLLSAACTATHNVRTVGKGNKAVEASFGGPMFTQLGGAIPVPNLFIGGRYGVREDMDVVAHYNLTAPIIPGIGLNLITGVQYVPIQPGIGIQRDQPTAGWSLSVKGTVHTLTDFVSGILAFPDLEIAGGYRHRWFNPYLGVSFGLHFFRPYDEVSPLLLSPFAGADFILNPRISLGLRVTVFDTTHNLPEGPITWVHLIQNDAGTHRYGMLGISLGFSYDFLTRPPTAPAPPKG